MKIAIGNDHAGTEYKTAIVEKLKEQGHEVTNFGTDKEDSVDYPDFIHPVATAVEDKEVELGIVICGSGNGAAMTANKHQQIRCALCWNKELAKLGRLHNNANVLSIPARFVSIEVAQEMVDVFLHTAFDGGRHERRVNKMSCS